MDKYGSLIFTKKKEGWMYSLQKRSDGTQRLFLPTNLPDSISQFETCKARKHHKLKSPAELKNIHSQA